MLLQNTILTGLIMLAISSCNNEAEKSPDSDKQDPASMEIKLKEENITYTGDNTTMHGYLVYDENKKGPLPAVLVVHEWWGLNDYAKSRARQLAGLGYVAMAIDMFGNGKTADNPGDAGKLAGPFYENTTMAKARFDAALEKIMSYPQTDTSRIGAIGYCFGGAQVLNMAKLGDYLKGVVSFHGNLNVVPANKDLLKAEILVCHGAADPFVPQAEVDQFKKQMDSIGAKYEFKAYEGAVHAFTNPAATAAGEKFKIPIKYDAAADSASWNDMKAFFRRIF